MGMHGKRSCRPARKPHPSIRSIFSSHGTPEARRLILLYVSWTRRVPSRIRMWGPWSRTDPKLQVPCPLQPRIGSRCTQSSPSANRKSQYCTTISYSNTCVEISGRRTKIASASGCALGEKRQVAESMLSTGHCSSLRTNDLRRQKL